MIVEDEGIFIKDFTVVFLKTEMDHTGPVQNGNLFDLVQEIRYDL